MKSKRQQKRCEGSGAKKKGGSRGEEGTQHNIDREAAVEILVQEISRRDARGKWRKARSSRGEATT
jgi:hypothetical protein